MKGGNTDSKVGEVQGYDYENVSQYGSVDMKGGKEKKGKKSTNHRKSSSKFDEFNFEKEWKEFETSYNQKYGGKAKAKKSTSTKKPDSIFLLNECEKCILATSDQLSRFQQMGFESVATISVCPFKDHDDFPEIQEFIKVMLEELNKYHRCRDDNYSDPGSDSDFD